MANNVSPLEEAALSGDTDRLYALIEEDPDMLNAVDAKPFVNTPLHIAASLKYLYFATEIMMLKPSFALKLNPQGFSPIHLAVKNGHSKLARRLVDMKKELVRVKGREGNTPLHFASQIGECDLLAYFLSACPDSILDVNARDETAVHIAVRNQQFDALGVLIGWLKGNTRKGAASLEKSILNSKDEEGNTILHLSALKGLSRSVLAEGHSRGPGP
ncbi:ankyrin repeat-containing protein BDA1-like [Arachis duranensis]|uniref:Ankyrin repeat-containing protein BDA1-like n=1 Tax=Arachis duranensis TaxID=130453 RepID=A0A9C6TTZ5_ARADU|nr:ankyrin repeat-containing protein BDA1-like [Arachis duranensis]